MLFKPELLAKVLAGTKTQTRRPVKPGDASRRPPLADGISEDIDLVMHNGRVKWEVGRTYAVCPRRGKYGVGRIRITAIRREDVRNISQEDVQAEGFTDLAEFYYVWTDMYDPAVNHKLPDAPSTRWLPPSIWQTWCEMVRERPADRYAAWCLTFCLEAPNDR